MKKWERARGEGARLLPVLSKRERQGKYRLRNHLYNMDWSKPGEWVRGRSTVEASVVSQLGINME